MASSRVAELQRFLAECTVRVISERPLGTGFFAAPSFVVTCAHVVTSVPLGQEVSLEWTSVSKSMRGRVKKKLPDPYNELFPDIALIEILDDVPDHPCVMFDEDYQARDSLYAWGYNDKNVAGEALTPELEGEGRRGSSRDAWLLKFRSAQTVLGMSGAPLLNDRTGRVCGMIKMSRDDQSDLGGFGIRASTILEHFPEISEFQAHYRETSPRWRWPLPFIDTATMPFETEIANFREGYVGTPDASVPFGGRTRELAILSEWLLNDSKPPYFLLTAPAGRGKSALLVYWLEQLQRRSHIDGQDITLDVVFVPISVRYGLNTAQQVFRAAAVRLQMIYGRDSAAIDPTDAEGWRQAFSSFIRREPPPGRGVLIVIDGLDEAAAWDVDPGLFPLAPAQRVRVVISARHTVERDAGGWRESLGWNDRPGIAAELCLDNLEIDGVIEIVADMLTDVHGEEVEKLATGLLRQTAGDPLTLGLYVRDLVVNPGSKHLLANEVIGAPTGLDGYFERWWQDQRRLWGDLAADREQEVSTLLNVLATALGPLPRRSVFDLVSLSGLGLSSEQLDRALSYLGRFTLNDRLTDSYVMSHPRLATYFLMKLRRDGQCERYDDFFRQLGRRALNSTNDASVNAQDPTFAYSVRYYSAHLQRSKADASCFLDLITRSWEAAWNAIDDHDGYASDVRRAWTHARAADDSALYAARMPFLGGEVRCAFELARRNDSTTSIRPGMLANMLRFGIWSESKAISYARLAGDATDRALSFAAIAPFLSAQTIIAVELFAHELIRETRGNDDYPLLEVLAPLCIRLSTLGLNERLLSLLRLVPPCAARARATIAVALQDPRDPSSAVANAFADLEDEDWLDRTTVIIDFADAPGAIARLDEQTRESIVGRMNTWADGDLLSDDQYLDVALPFLRTDVAEELVRETFRRIEAGPSIRGRTVVVEIAKYLPESLLEEALEFSAADPDPADAAYSLSSLMPRLGEDVREKWARVVVDAVPSAMHAPSIDDREGFLEQLCRAGFIDIAAEVIWESQDRYNIGHYLAKVAPYLTKAQVVRFLNRDDDIWREVHIRSILLERLSCFSRGDCSNALSRLSDESFDHERRVGNLTLGLCTAETDLERHALVDELLHLADPDSVLNAIPYLLGRATQIDGNLFVKILAYFQDDYRAVDALAILTPRIKTNCMYGVALEAFSNVVRRASDCEGRKLPALAGYFRRLREIDEFDALNVALELSSKSFRLPLIAAAMGFGAEVADSTRLRLRDELSNLEYSIDQLMVFAVLSPILGVNKWRKCYVAQHFEAKSICLHGRKITTMLSFLPPHVREHTLVEILTQVEDLSALHQEGRADWMEGFISLASIMPPDATLRVIAQLHVFPSGKWQDGARRALGVRMAEHGKLTEGLELIRWIGDSDLRIRALEEIIIAAGPADVSVVVDAAFDWVRSHDQDLSPLWTAVLPRWAEIAPETRIGIVRQWLERSCRLGRKTFFREIAGFATPIWLHGGREAMNATLELTSSAGAVAG